ncbi:hypothetical protein A2819_00930 [Candidatus Azambacteria bacterium RIFCSPHIGHO2_01_FULL_40_24]|uniref:PilN domain-containing protein n=1 Tax=Candidatus Azambacteria bacterium RIFCSPHIGHO2_01_FULL_40_24 TaxID=1797301 RepID=A0A1F5B2G6_9BACT|nr:MAG: hypothetical protein A2819_00930 [Candidatus Azambacteria bacterium RIFCSPHIGHO2_01_FULL_40_24]
MVEITPQKPKLILPNWSWPLWLSFSLFFLSIFAFLFLKVYLARIQEEIVNINNQIKTEVGKVSVDDENAVIRLSDSLAALGGIISNHSYFSNVFSLVGSLTYSKAVFIKFDADRDTGIINLRGLTQSYTALAKQIVALRENEYVKNLEIKGINFGNTGLEFELTLGVDPAMFIKK